MADELEAFWANHPLRDWCGPCLADYHTACYWHDGEDCECPCHDGYRRFEAAVPTTSDTP